MNKLPGDYIAGFVDGEGCFALKFRRDVRHKRKGVPVYFYWDIEFIITLRKDDVNILKKIRDVLNCGSISFDKRGAVRYSVNNMNDLMNKIVPFFEVYRLRAKKRFDFILWVKALKILYKNRGAKTSISSTGDLRGYRNHLWDKTDLGRLQTIHQKMKTYKSGVKEWKWLLKIKPSGNVMS